MTRETTEVRGPSHPSADIRLGQLGITAGSTATRASRAWQLAFGSLPLHASAVAALLVLPLLREASMPSPAHTIDAFFVTPRISAPPPPAPAAAHSAAGPNARTTDTQAFVAPIEIPDAIEWASSDLDLGIEGGLAGGVEGAPRLKDAAIEAVRQWRYTPTLYGGVPVPLEMRITVSFRLS